MKINSIHFGGKMITLGLLIGGVIPFIIWIISGVIFWPLCIIGICILIFFGIIFAIEMRQDNGKIPYYEKKLAEEIPYDPNMEYAIIRASICTGEKVVGFSNRKTGVFREVMLIRNDADLERFKKIYGIETVTTVY